MYDGVKLDNSWAEDGSNLVTVSFSGERIERASMEADQIEILHLETPTQAVSYTHLMKLMLKWYHGI